MASFRTAVDCNTNVANSIKIQNLDARITEAVELLKQLIATPSRSRDEARTADLLHAFLAQRGAAPERLANNVWARAEGFDPARPTLLLNSHHDTVRPAASYTRDPYAPTVEDGKLYGLGSNDAGASVVCLLETFLTFRTRPLPFNLVLGISAEEECMGENGIRALLPALGKVDMALVGEPTGMQAATGERGLVICSGGIFFARSTFCSDFYITLRVIRSIPRRIAGVRQTILLVKCLLITGRQFCSQCQTVINNIVCVHS